MNAAQNNTQAIINAGIRIRGVVKQFITSPDGTKPSQEVVDQLVEDGFTLGMNLLVDINRIANSLEVIAAAATVNAMGDLGKPGSGIIRK